MKEPSKTILIVEDDESIVMGLSMNLEAEGYVVHTASDGQLAIEAARSEDFALLILDVMLPKVNGFEVLRQLRAEGYAMPVIMLSARGAEIDKVMGLELGAEDYITKPFSLAEFLARVKAVLRRDAIARPQPAPTLVQGGVRIDTRAREVFKDSERVELTATEFDILRCLADAAGEVLSREEIQRRVWGPGHHGTLRTIDNFVLQLRAKLEEDPTAPKHLLTVRGVGYRLAD